MSLFTIRQGYLDNHVALQGGFKNETFRVKTTNV